MLLFLLSAAFCESVVVSVELRRAGMSLCFARETDSVDIQRRSFALPSLHAILKDTQTRLLSHDYACYLLSADTARSLTGKSNQRMRCASTPSPPQGPDYKDIEAEINKELENDKHKHVKKMPKKHKELKRHQPEEVVEEEERWPSPMEPFDYDSDGDSPGELSSMIPLEVEEQTEEEKKYILEKIEQANRELLDQEPPHESRRRRLHFKDKLVDLVVPPLHFKQEGSCGGRDDGGTSSHEAEVSERFSELKLSPRSSEGGQGEQEGKVLVEKDGKFDLVSLNELESRGRLPPIANGELGHSSASSSSRTRAQHLLPAPRPPAHPRNRPSSASHGRRGGLVNSVKRRVQSATGTTGSQVTYILSAQQKELLQRVQRRKERLAREVGTRIRQNYFSVWLCFFLAPGFGFCFNRPRRRSERKTSKGSRRTSWHLKPGC